MKLRKNSRLILSVIAATSILTACGGGGSGSGSGSGSGGASGTPQTGLFVDSPVAGLTYRTATQSGTTSALGEYKYLPNETVTFSIGAVSFPAVAASGTVTPLDIFNTTDPSDRRVVNMLVLLQSLDEDANASNGIKIPSGANTAATNPINFDVPYATFVTDSVVTGLVANSGSVTHAPVTDVAASAHFHDTLTGSNGATKVNVAPRATAGAAASVRQRSTVQLSGTAADANGDTLTFLWTMTSKPAASNTTLTGSTTLTPTFYADEAGDYTLSLVASDGSLSSPASTVTVTVAAIPMVTPSVLAARGISPTLGAANCAAVQASVNATPATFADADMQQANDVLSTIDPGAYAIFKKLPDTFAWWMRGNYGTTSVSMLNLTIAIHETSHGIQNVNSFQCGATAFKYLLDGTVYTTDLTSGATVLYSIVSQTYPLATKPPRYNVYVAATPFAPSNDARIMLDELTAYSTAARLAINMMHFPEYGNLTSYEDGDLAGMVDFMLFTQSYLKAARLNAPATYTALQSANTKAYIQTLWTFAEANLQQSIPYAYTAAALTYIANKPMFINANVLAQVYTPSWLAELDALGITHKAASDWSGIAAY
jgi:hypothetical protein